MKKFLKSFVVVLLILSGIYTIAAYFLIRGLGIYRLGTTVGAILANSWQYTGLAALILLICTVIILVKGKKKGKEEKIAPAAPQAEGDSEVLQQPETPKEAQKKHQKKAKTAPEKVQPSDKIPPAVPAAAETELLPENTADATELLSKNGEATELLPENETVPLSAAAVSLTADAPAAEATMLLHMDEPEQKMPPHGETGPMSAEEIVQRPVCPQCGAETKAGAKFCIKCGMRLGG